ncbi:11776_t:CDS:2 [Ambispora gerdemannii]|uniref:11776_t:CDS:1 n=1 Tax=Ambispora gerdemannii TaxID=144530 RepID=A0A9N9F3R1_9GLOM|nr:11776_t:CDS:2 [Ambispora gerdemannii]
MSYQADERVVLNVGGIKNGKGAPLSNEVLTDFDYFESSVIRKSSIGNSLNINGNYMVSHYVNKLVGSSAYAVLEQFSKDIEAHVNSAFPRLTTKFTHHPNGFKYLDNFTVPIPILR